MQPEGSRKAKSPQGDDERDIVILFADIVGCSEISNNKQISGYNKFITGFQTCFGRICDHHKNLEYEQHEHSFFDAQVRGDEGCLKIFIPRGDESLSKDIHVAINIALDLKRAWLLGEENRGRINDGLLPVDLGIGVHAGKAFVNKDPDGPFRPEGYAINLAKRIESESRGGKFSHIFVSEAAREQLYDLKDECVYRFDKPFTISPKGIARDIKGFEVKHHFLPTDWTDKPAEVSMIYGKLTGNGTQIVGIAKKAYEINPTNLWLAEEYLLLSVMDAYRKLDESKKTDDPQALKKGYAPALEVARRIANSDLRDPGLLAIWGFVAGEQREYEEEQRRYEEALAQDEQDGDIWWYKAYSLSSELYDIQRKSRKDNVDAFCGQNKSKIEEALTAYARALDLRPMNPWIAYDYACELSWWSQAKQNDRRTAIDILIRAFSLNSDTKESARDEEYLEPIIDDPQVKKYLAKPD